MFMFKGISSEDMGITLDDELFNQSPDTNYQEDAIEGHDGSLFTELNFMNISITKNATLNNLEKADAVKEWLHGTGVFEYKGKCKIARIFTGLNYTRFGPFRYQFQITFIMDPFWYVNTGFMEVKDSIINLGNITAKPVVMLKGSGSTDLCINDVRFEVTFDEDGEITIDCDKMEETKPKCISIGYKYPTLKPGKNKIIVYTGSPTIYVKRKDRWI